MTDTDFFPTGHYMSLYLEADVVQQTFSIWKISWLLPLQHTTRTLRSQRGILQMKLGCWCNWFSSPIPKLSVLNICKVIISCPTPCVCVYFPLFVRLSWRSEGLFIFVETAEHGCGIGDTCDVCTQQFWGQANVLTAFGKWGERHGLTWGMFSNWGRVLAGYR